MILKLASHNLAKKDKSLSILAKKGGQVDGTDMTKYFPEVAISVNLVAFPPSWWSCVTIFCPTELI